MKKFLQIPAMCALSLLFACTTDSISEEQDVPPVQWSMVNGQSSTAADESLFPETDNSTVLSSLDASTGLLRCLQKAGDDLGSAWDGTKCSKSEYEEIGTLVDELVKDATTEKDKMQAIYGWITKNVKYDNKGENKEQSAYYTYKYHVANCQGYSNLMNTMCHWAGLNCFNVNGFVTAGKLGHAWNYVRADGKWYVMDSTNSRYWLMTSTSSYKEELYPSKIDVTLFEDDNFKYTWYGDALSVVEVKQADTQLTIPFSINGLRIFSFNPTKDIPSTVREIYLGSNITTLGDESNMGIANYCKKVEAVYVASASRKLMSENGIVYRMVNRKPQLYFIPTAMTYVILSSQMTEMKKNTLYHLPNVETLVIPSSVKRIEQWAVEDAPNLRLIHVPEECKYVGVDKNYNEVEYDEPTDKTFVGVHKDCQIIKGSPTGIRDITI